MVRAVACEARVPGFDSSSDRMVFLLSPWVQGGRYKMAPAMINCVVLHIHLDKKDHSDPRYLAPN